MTQSLTYSPSSAPQQWSGAAPQWATQRSFDRPTYGPAAAKLAEILGTPFMPWQRYCADVALEVMPDGSWAYQLAVITVQRQAGKTTFTGPVSLHRALTVRNGRTWLTAQRRQDARDTWMDFVQRVRQSPLRAMAEIRESNGGEALTLPSGGTFRVFAPTEDALHGKANHLVTVDEGWAMTYLQGLGLEQAIFPTFTTTGGQLCLVSTAGTAESVWLRGYVDRGRAAVEADRRSGICYFEWSLPAAHVEEVTAGLDADSTQVQRDRAIDLIVAAHPANGYTLQRSAVAQAADVMRPAEFLRAYGNVWTMTADTVIPAHLWSAGRAEIPRPEPGQLALGYGVALDRSDAAIGAAWRDGEDRICVDVITHAPGAAWLPDRLRQVAPAWRAPVGYDRNGPALAVADELARDTDPLALIGTQTREHALACSTLLAAIEDGRLRHPGDPVLDAAVAAAATRTLGDGFAWSRRTSAASIAALDAVTAALWALDHGPEAMPAPALYVRNR